MGERGRKRVQLASLGSLDEGMRGWMDEGEGEASVKIMVSINCFAYILYPLLTTFQQKQRITTNQAKLIVNKFPDHVYLAKSSLGRYFCDPSQSGEHLEIQSPFQKNCLPTSSFLSPIPLFSPCQAYFFLYHLVELGRKFYTFHSLYSWFFSFFIFLLQPLSSLLPVLLTPFQPLLGQFFLPSFFLIPFLFLSQLSSSIINCNFEEMGI